MKNRLLIGIGLGVLCVGIGVGAQNGAPSADQTAVAQKAEAVLTAHCGKCHDATATAGFSLRNRTGMFAKKQLIAGDPEHSRLYIRAALSNDDPMPPATENNPLSPEEKNLLKTWIQQGCVPAPVRPAEARARKFVPTEQILAAIADDLKQADERDRPFLRYFTLTHLYNAGAQTEEITAYRNALAKLLNSLSWQKRIVVPAAIEPTGTVFRIDMRRYTWTAGTWKRLLTYYPYRVVSPSETAKAITTATECDLPLIRADWFVSHAARPPLYHDLLDLPHSAGELEKKLLVDVEKNIREETAMRAGFSESGVSRNNRIVERHESPYGAYWRSYDFSGSVGKQNIFQYPLGFEPAGGEIIFNLPNGMQGYMLVNGQGERINNGPIEIVSNKTNPSDPIVRNGLTCMTCHTRGLKPFTDQVRDVISKNQTPDYDKNKCLALYGLKPAMDQLFSEDLKRYASAMKESGNEIGDTEPIALLSNSYEAPVTVARAAAEVGMQTEEFRTRLKDDPMLTASFGVLLSDSASIKRDAWEAGFGTLCRELALGTFTGVRVLVSKAGDGDFTTIGEAVRSAQPGAEISIQPGVYKEKVVLNKPLTLVGDGPAGAVTIQESDGEAIVVSGAAVRLQEISLRGAAGAGIRVTHGKVDISACDIAVTLQTGLELNDGASATLMHTAIHDVAQGIRLANESGAVVTDCDIFQCAREGVAVAAGGGHVLLQKSRIHDTGQGCVEVSNHGRATLSDCDISASKSQTCINGFGADFTIQACKIHHSGMQGLHMESSHVTIDHSEIYDNAWEGVSIFNNSVATVTTSKIKGNHFSGFRIFNATVGIDDCDVLDNTQSGIDMGQSRLTVENCRIGYNGLQGVQVKERSTATVKNSVLHNNMQGPFAVDASCRLTNTANKQ